MSEAWEPCNTCAGMGAVYEFALTGISDSCLVCDGSGKLEDGDPKYSNSQQAREQFAWLVARIRRLAANSGRPVTEGQGEIWKEWSLHPYLIEMANYDPAKRLLEDCWRALTDEGVTVVRIVWRDGATTIPCCTIRFACPVPGTNLPGERVHRWALLQGKWPTSEEAGRILKFMGGPGR